MKIGAYQFLLVLVLTISILVIGLRGTVPQETGYQSGSLQNATSISGIGLGQKLWNDNFTSKNGWHLTTPNTTTAYFQVNRTLIFGVDFSSQASSQAVSVSEGLDLLLDRNPVVNVQVEVSQGIHYGMRFFGQTPAGTTFNAWQEDSALQHRSGLGTSEDISTSLSLEAYVANGQVAPIGSKITQITFYMEATSGTVGRYLMEVTSMTAYSQQQTEARSSDIAGPFLAVAINLNLPSTSLSLFQTFVSFEIRGTSDLHYTLFLVNGTSVLAQGFTYIQTSASSHQDAVLLPQLSADFPEILSLSNTTQLVISSIRGEINYFKLDNLSFKYTSTPLDTQGLVDPASANLVLSYYLLFLFVTPIAAIILITKVFKNED